MLNNMCKDCKKLGDGCNGSFNSVWSGCIYKEKGAELENIKENVKASLLAFGYAEAIMESVVNDIVSLERPGVALVKQKICGKYTGKLTEMYL